MALFRLPVAIQSHVFKSGGTTIYYPRIVSLPDRQAEERMNRAINQTVLALQQEQLKALPNAPEEMVGHYEVKTNERGLLSILFTNYAYAPHMAHGNTVAKSLTFNTETGTIYTLASLFQPNANYVAKLSAIVAEQIKRREIPLLNGFQRISPQQPFYLADKALVLYYPLYELSPYYVGFPMFPIPVYDIVDIAAEQGPLDRLAADIA